MPRIVYWIIVSVSIKHNFVLLKLAILFNIQITPFSDLDHRGKSNKFMLDSESPIAAIYSTSTMEHHHFNQTVTILQQDGHNILAKLSSTEYKQILSLIKVRVIEY